MTKWFSARSKKGDLVRKLSRLKRTSAVMQLSIMFTSATLKDFKISLTIISLNTDASESCACLHDKRQAETFSCQVINIEFTVSPCASLAHQLELMIAI